MDLLTPPSSQPFVKHEESDQDTSVELLSYEVLSRGKYTPSPHLPPTPSELSDSTPTNATQTRIKAKRKPKLKYRPPNGSVLNIESYDPGICITEQDDDIDNEDVSFLHYAFKHSKRMAVVTGAGISVASGIPDFRSANGLFQGLKSSTSAGSNGKALFDSSVYGDDESTAKFHAMINTLYDMTQKCQPTEFHKVMDGISGEGRLLRHYTQNIDCLESELPHLQTTVPIKANPPYPPTIQLHGTIRHMYCSKCRWSAELIPSMFQGDEPPECPECVELDEIRRMSGKRSQGIGCLRPRIVLYNEFHPDGEHIGKVSYTDLRSKPDCLVIAGTSLKIPGVRRLVKELAKAVHAANGCVIWINRDEPSMSVVDYIEHIDLIVTGDCQDVPSIVDSYDEFLQKQKKTRKRPVKKEVTPMSEAESKLKPSSLPKNQEKVTKATPKKRMKKENLMLQSNLDTLVTKLNEVK